MLAPKYPSRSPKATGHGILPPGGKHMTYTAPLADMRFALREVAGLARVSALPGYEHATDDTVDAVLEEAAKLAGNGLAPLNRDGDKVGAKLENGVVRTAPGFAGMYREFVDGGWNSLPFDPEFGGQGMPWLLAATVQEMWQAANMGFGLVLLLNQGAIDAIHHHGSPEQRTTYLPKMISGEWTGTMNLTEPQAGSDLGQLKSRAIKNGDHYLVTGQKIFITYGEHDMAENIVHLVLARTPDAPAGVKGISLFVVPKLLLDASGAPSQTNDVRCISIEHKLGIHGSPTATLSFGDEGGAVGWLIGEENRGLEYMFTMMNVARLSVGVEGIDNSERAYQAAAAFSRERVQGRPVGDSSGERSPILGHMDVRRMLLDMRARIEAMRAVAYSCAAAIDRAHHHPDEAERQRSMKLADLLTSVVKGWCTEWSIAITSTGVQVFGGMGYIEETGVAQHFRDARITTIYEGTTGIQAADLVGRKVLRDQGASFRELLRTMRTFTAVLERESTDPLPAVCDALVRGMESLEAAISWLQEAAGRDKRLPLAAAVPFLELTGTVLGGYEHARAALRAQALLQVGGGDTGYLEAKLGAARFYAASILPRAHAHLLSMVEGAQAVVDVSDSVFKS